MNEIPAYETSLVVKFCKSLTKRNVRLSKGHALLAAVPSQRDSHSGSSP